MDNFGYWIFLLILYALSAMMKRKKQKAAYRKLDEEEDNWEAPNFVKDLFPDITKDFFSDLTESENAIEETEEPDDITYGDIKDEVRGETQQDNKTLVSLDKIHLPQTDLSTIDEDVELGNIRHVEQPKRKKKTTFFQNNQDLKTAVIYKEILDRPRSLRRSIR